MGERSHERTYVGRLDAGRPAVYAVHAGGVERLRSCAGRELAWGAGPRASAERLAGAILVDAAGAEASGAARRRFAAEVLGRLPADGFVLPGRSVATWLRRALTV